MVSSSLERFPYRVLVCRGRLGSLLISSRMEMLDAALERRFGVFVEYIRNFIHGTPDISWN